MSERRDLEAGRTLSAPDWNSADASISKWHYMHKSPTDHESFGTALSHSAK